MRTSTITLALAATASAQYSSELLAHNPGGILQAGAQGPSIAGFKNATLLPARGGFASCVSGWVNVTASTSKNLKFNTQIPQNQSQVTETFLEYVTQGSPFMQEIMGGTQSVNGTFEIGATLCVPSNNTAPSQVQFLTHGVGFDRTYWDWAPGYSYADFAATQGIATFFYDRLGVGLSAKPDALNTVQAPLEVEIANTLATHLRRGAFSNLTFTHVIGAGHSFGSLITQSITAQYPSTFDAAILTGFSVNATAMPTFLIGLNLAIASQNQPYRFAGLPNGYLVSNDAKANQIGFFRAPGFDPAVLNLAEATKGTVTIGELLSQNAIMMPAVNYTKPVAVVNGANDLPFCFGNCTYPSNLAEKVFPILYPKVTVNGTYAAEVAGHGLNLHYSAVEAYSWIQKFVMMNVK